MAQNSTIVSLVNAVVQIVVQIVVIVIVAVVVHILLLLLLLLLQLLLLHSLLSQILLIAGKTRCCSCCICRRRGHALLQQLLLQAATLQQLLLQQLQLLLLHALIEAYLLQLLRTNANVARFAVLGNPLPLMLQLLRHIVILLGGAVTVAAAAGAAAVAVARATGDMLPAGRVVAIGIAGLRIALAAVVGAIDAGPGAGGTAFGNVYESHDEGEQQQQHLVVAGVCCCRFIFGQSAADQRCDVAKMFLGQCRCFCIAVFLVIGSFF